MRYFEKHPMTMIVIGVIGISLSSIFVKYSNAPSAVTAAFRLLWTVILMTPAVGFNSDVKEELKNMTKRNLLLSCVSGLFLAVHFAVWFESLQHTSVASSTTIVCTEVIWVALGFCLFLHGKLTGKAIAAILITFAGSALIALADSGGGTHLYGDFLALLAATAVAVYTLIGRIVRETVSTTAYTYVVYIACAAMLVGMCIVQDYNLFTYGWSAVIVGLLLAVFSTILGHSIFSWCLKYFSPAFVSASKLCEPVVAAIFAGLLFGEMPKLLQVIGCILILGGVYYYSRLEMHQD
ncbi:MAG: DMT family transporter [Oscillospiraceae bacterium]|nr:DMT family transporter [Oscillospiraceae bacterium]